MQNAQTNYKMQASDYNCYSILLMTKIEKKGQFECSFEMDSEPLLCTEVEIIKTDNKIAQLNVKEWTFLVIYGHRVIRVRSNERLLDVLDLDTIEEEIEVWTSECLRIQNHYINEPFYRWLNQDSSNSLTIKREASFHQSKLHRRQRRSKRGCLYLRCSIL